MANCDFLRRVKHGLDKDTEALISRTHRPRNLRLQLSSRLQKASDRALLALCGGRNLHLEGKVHYEMDLARFPLDLVQHCHKYGCRRPEAVQLTGREVAGSVIGVAEVGSRLIVSIDVCKIVSARP